jgi:hypothetical protein
MDEYVTSPECFLGSMLVYCTQKKNEQRPQISTLPRFASVEDGGLRVWRNEAGSKFGFLCVFE